MSRTESSAASRTLAEAQDRFIAAWGQMGSAWGISRTMAEAHALLYIVGEPLNTDDVMERLQISRGNASMSLRALLEWGLVSREHKRGDRKEYFRAEADVWTMLRTIVRERIKREVDPVLASLYDIRDMTAPARVGDIPVQCAKALADHNDRLDSMVDTIDSLHKLAERFTEGDGKKLRQAAKALSKIV